MTAILRLFALLGLTIDPLSGPVAAVPLAITANDRNDAVDTAPGDGVCRTAGGTCTLRAAIVGGFQTNGASGVRNAGGTRFLSDVTLRDNWEGLRMPLGNRLVHLG